ncbi:unnamed protein product [Nippostrongylus brasiliensis]|uniref:Integrase n=1 Tax=Nippostrongylus brasiliensis TaxID=27835 RepID=A0A0N4XWE5_NIPBR|nr:unnamed protein product [Nippostrongylus brasiliensis]
MELDECWPATKEVERRFSAMGMKMLRWMAGVTRLDHITIADTRERFGGVPIAEKLRETRLRWYGHVLRASDDTVCKIGLAFDVLGTRPREHSKQRWVDTIHADLKAVGVHPFRHMINLHGVGKLAQRTLLRSGKDAKEEGEQGCSL